jgi:hypothetical protein
MASKVFSFSLLLAPMLMQVFLSVVGPPVTGVHDLALVHDVADIHALADVSSVLSTLLLLASMILSLFMLLLAPMQ